MQTYFSKLKPFYKMDTKNKTVVSCRLDEQLKNELQAEATERDMTISSYIEEVMQQRATNANANSAIHTYSRRTLEAEAEIERLQAEIVALSSGNENVNENLTQQCAEFSIDNKKLRERILQLEAHCKQLVQAHDATKQTRPYWISETTHQRIVGTVKQLKSIRSDFSEEQLLLLAAEITLKNEQSDFTTLTINDFMKRNSTFFTSKTLTA
jgi:predicted DNA-binding ribbon-helix-helix protein